MTLETESKFYCPSVPSFIDQSARNIASWPFLLGGGDEVTRTIIFFLFSKRSVTLFAKWIMSIAKCWSNTH